MLHIIIDTREQTPWHFPEHLAEVSRGCIRAGDYALAGDEDGFAIERKSLDDFVGTISTGWDRFMREVERMILFPAAIVIIEDTFARLINHEYNHPQVTPAFVMKRIAQLAFMRVTVLFCDNPATAAGTCYVILKERKAVLDA